MWHQSQIALQWLPIKYRINIKVLLITRAIAIFAIMSNLAINNPTRWQVTVNIAHDDTRTRAVETVLAAKLNVKTRPWEHLKSRKTSTAAVSFIDPLKKI